MVRPRDAAGKTRRRMAAEELADLQRLDVTLKAMKAELKTAVAATGSHLMDIHGIGPAGAARILADVGDVNRFPNRNHFASRPAPPRSRPPAASTPPPAVPGREPAAEPRPLHGRHRPAPPRHPRPRLLPAQARHRENLHGSDALPAPPPVRRRLPPAHRRRPRTRRHGPGRALPATLLSSAADLPPGTGTSDQPLPGPAPTTLPPPPAALTPPGARVAATPRRRAGGVNVQRPQRASARTNDIDTDQRRRSLNSAAPPS